MRDSEKTVGTIIDKQKICFLGSIDVNGFPTIRAMLKPRKRDGIKTIYFHTNTSSLKISEFKNNQKACVYFCDSRFFRGIMLQGTVEVLEDQASKDELWQFGDEIYYPLGKTDPDYCVLKLTTQHGRYYSNFKSEDFAIN